MACVVQVGERHAQRCTVKSFFGLGEEQSHKTEFSFDADHPEIFASEDNGITPVEYVLVGSGELPDGWHRGSRAEP